MSAEYVSPDDLAPHPKNAEIYGTLDLSERFIEDVAENGIEQPIIIVEDSQFTDNGKPVILSGHKRRAAASETGHNVPIGERKSFDTPANELDTLLRHNDYRDKTFSQRMGEADAIHEVEQAAAQERMEDGTPSGQMTTGLARDKVADRVGFGSGRTYARARKVWDAAKDGNPAAEDLVSAIDAGEESISGAHRTLKQVESFETNESISALLDDLVADDRLTERDVTNLKASAPDTVLGYLANEHDIQPFTDGTRPVWMPQSKRKEGNYEGGADAVYEVGNVPIEAVESPLKPEHAPERLYKPDNELLGLLVRLYTEMGAESGLSEPLPVVVRPDGSYVSLDETRRTALEALRVTGHDTVLVAVKAIDGSDDDIIRTATTLISIIEDEFTVPVASETREDSLTKLADEHDEPERASILRELSEYHGRRGDSGGEYA